MLVIRHCLPELVPAEAEQDGHIHDLLLLRRAIKLLQVHIECRGESVPVNLRLVIHRELVIARPYELALIERVACFC